MHSYFPVKKGVGVRPYSRAVENQSREVAEGLSATAPPVMKRDMESDIPKTATIHCRIAGCGHCMARGASQDREDGKRALGSG